MLKEYSILLSLLFAFSVGLVHDILPHHHHSEIIELGHHHQDTDDGHHFDDSGEHQHDEPLGYFSHISHLKTYNEFEHFTTQKTPVEVEVNKDLYTHLFVNKRLLFGNLLSILALDSEHSRYVCPENKQFFYYSYPLRGPPTQLS